MTLDSTDSPPFAKPFSSGHSARAQAVLRSFTRSLSAPCRPARRWLHLVMLLAIIILSVLKFVHLDADFPNESPWLVDQAKFTDEGWWGNAAVHRSLTGNWYEPGDYNPAAALPVWPLLLGLLFHLTGVSVIAARSLNVSLSIATLGLVFLLVRRFIQGKTAALLATLLLSASPFAFAFNRLAILETLVIFEFCLLMLCASSPLIRRFWMLGILALLTAAMVLTKTTAALLIPSVFWIAWSATGRTRSQLWRIALALIAVPAAFLKTYELRITRLGYGADYDYFFSANAMPPIDWRQTFALLAGLLQHCFWIDRFLYPLGLVILTRSIASNRKLWLNPLFAASGLALAAQAVFIFSRQQDYAPRYFLVMLPPLIWIAVLAFDDLAQRNKLTAPLLFAVLASSVLANAIMIGHFLTRPDYDFQAAASSIRHIVQDNPQQNPLILGVSADQIALMAGIPALNDGFGTEEMESKVARYNPGWYLAWDDMDPAHEPYLSPFDLQPAASFSIFDNDGRSTLTLYKLVRKPAPSAR